MTETSAKSGGFQGLEGGHGSLSNDWNPAAGVTTAAGRRARGIDGITGPDMRALRPAATWERVTELRIKLALWQVYSVVMTIGFLVFLLAWGRS